MMRVRILPVIFCFAVVCATGPGSSKAQQATDTAARPLSTANIPPPYRGAVADLAIKLGPYYRNLRRGKAHYLQFIRGLLNSAAMPEELALVAVVESGFSAEATSVDGAAGVWQLMPAVAMESGLSLAPADQRRDVYKSSHVALRILRDLHRRFGGDPLTVVAAYNCGSGRMEGAGAGASTAYWAVHPALPPETQLHVLKYLAAVTAFYDQPLPVRPPARAFARDTASSAPGLSSADLSASYREAIILDAIGMDPALFRQLNPALDETLARSGSYEMHLPKPEMLRFLQHKRTILLRSMKEPLAKPSPPAIVP